MRPARGVIVAAALGFVIGSVGAGALAEPVTPKPAVVLDCPRLAEDSAAHVRLVSYQPGLIVYQCERSGY